MPVLKNSRHEKFAKLVSDGKSASASYRKAGYSAKGKSSDEAASRLSRNIKVAARILELKERSADRAEITRASVLRELGLIGFANMLDYMRAGGDGDPVLDFSQLTRDQAAALSEVTVEDFTDGRGDDARDVRRVKFKLYDKRAALVDLGKHLGLFKEQGDVHVHIGDDEAITARRSIEGRLAKLEARA